jgi:predicted nucleic acid-binding protein
MRFVLDAAIAIRWVVPEVDSGKALQLRDRLKIGADEFFAPDVFPVEVAHALTRSERQRRIQVGEAAALLSGILLSAPTLLPALQYIDRAVEISSTHRIGVYDCLYIALAEQLGCDMITCDERLVANLLPHGFPVVALRSI